MNNRIHGLVPILATPFQPDGSLDLSSLRRLTEFQLESGVDGVAVSGMASEAFALTAAESRKVLAEVVRVVDGSIPVVAGINGTSTVTSIEQAQAAEAEGAKCLMVLPPFMVKPSATQVVDFYGEIAAAVEPDVMVQDAPNVTGVSMSTETVAAMSALSGVTSVKVEAPPTALKVSAVAEAVGDDDFAILGGQNAQFCLEEYARGAIGTMPACEFSDLLAPVLTDWKAGRRNEARQAFAKLLPLMNFGLQQGIAWAVHKEVLVARGVIDHTTVRSPARQLDHISRESLAEILEMLALLKYR